MKVVRGLAVVGLLMAVSASAVAAEPGHGQGNGRGHDKQQASGSSSSKLSSSMASGEAADGSADPNVVVTVPGATTAVAAVVCSSEPDVWAAALRNSEWISPIANCTAGQAAGQYRYDITFNVPSGTTGLSLEGLVRSDDSVIGLSLNTHPLTLTGPGGFTAPMSFEAADQSFFVAGTNTLSFTVDNIAAQTGLDFQFRIRAANVAGEADNEGKTKSDNHGQCVSDVAHSTAHGPGHGEAVSEAAHSCA